MSLRCKIYDFITILSLDQPSSEALNISEAPGEKEDLLETGEQRNDTFGLDLENDFKPVKEMQLECSSLTGDDNTNQDDNQTLDVNPVQSLGACCAELLMEQLSFFFFYYYFNEISFFFPRLN